MMGLSRVELAFVAAGGVLGAVVAFVSRAGALPDIAGFPPFVFVLLGLALVEIIGGFATGRAPGALIAMPARIGAFALGVCVLLLLEGRLA